MDSDPFDEVLKSTAHATLIPLKKQFQAGPPFKTNPGDVLNILKCAYLLFKYIM